VVSRRTARGRHGRVLPLDLTCDRFEDRPCELLGHAFPNRAAFDEDCPVDAVDHHVPPVAQNALGFIADFWQYWRGQGGRWPDASVRCGPGDRRAVDEYLGFDDQILIDGAIAIVEARRILGEQRQVFRRGNFGDDAAAERSLGVTSAVPALAKPFESRREADGRERQHEGKHARNDITHGRSSSITGHYNASVPSRASSIARAYAACESLARSHYENFPVASWLLPRAMRPHIAAVYAFARTADDIADEGVGTPEERQARLDRWRCRLHTAVAAPENVAEPAEDPESLIVIATASSIRSLSLPIGLFDDLLSAFSQDTTTNRYASWEDIFDYCRRSANPVGRLVLRIAGYDNEMLALSSDALCTALQLTNFWQDFGRDWRAGRLYVPADVAAECGAREEDLTRPSMNPAWVTALGRCMAVTRERYDAGKTVCDTVRGRLRFELRLTWLGGRRLLERASRTCDELLTHRPTLGAGDLPHLLWQAARWKTNA